MRVISVPQVDVIPRALGYGTAKPQRVWRAVSRVQGFILETSLDLRSGSFVESDDLLLRIDPAEYLLEIEKLKAEIDKTEASLMELVDQELNDRLSLEIEEGGLRIVRQELERDEQLFIEDAGSQAEVDASRRALLRQQQSVQGLKNHLNLIPSQRRSLKAELAAARVRLAAAKLNLSYTEFKAPFNARIGEVNLQPGQFVSIGQELFEAYDTDVSQIEAQVSFSQIQKLLADEKYQTLKSDFQKGRADIETLQRILQVRVIQRSGPIKWEWPGRVMGFRETVDIKTRMYGLIVEVDDPYSRSGSTKHPPLLKDAYCEIEVDGPLREQQIVIPASAFHNGGVYVIDAQHRLQRREVKIAFQQNNLIVIDSGLEADEILVVSSPSPAVEGLLVTPVHDEALLSELRARGLGEDAVR
ncbi:MAG: HlyD family efflux transporter periplasmic adaptor subunit [Desulfuromonadaceae bacterium]|nr:HlyD family efflux transporter periplasmic adaptor subunit [Desulfuromonadaceae bacterium]